MTQPTYPNVPVAPGVPPVFRAGQPDTGEQPRKTDGAGAANNQASSAPRWGVFDASGASVITVDSVVRLEYLREFRISTYPVETGGFASYDKVATPADVRVLLVRGGSDDNRRAFLRDLDRLVASTQLYTVVCPEVSYANVNVVKYDYRRSSENGVTLIAAEVQLSEVRVSATQVFTNSKSPAGSDAVNSGSVQTRTPTPAQTPKSYQFTPSGSPTPLKQVGQFTPSQGPR